MQYTRGHNVMANSNQSLSVNLVGSLEKKQFIFIIIEPSHEKTNILVSDLVQHKPGCTATEDG